MKKQLLGSLCGVLSLLSTGDPAAAELAKRHPYYVGFFTDVSPKAPYHGLNVIREAIEGADLTDDFSVIMRKLSPSPLNRQINNLHDAVKIKDTSKKKLAIFSVGHDVKGNRREIFSRLKETLVEYKFVVLDEPVGSIVDYERISKQTLIDECEVVLTIHVGHRRDGTKATYTPDAELFFSKSLNADGSVPSQNVEEILISELVNKMIGRPFTAKTDNINFLFLIVDDIDTSSGPKI